MGELSGYFSVFNTPYRVYERYLGEFFEIVASGSFERSFRERTPVVNLNHGRDPGLGQRPLGPILELREDSVGAFYRVRPLPGVPEMVLEGLRENLYGSSFTFSPEDERWDEYPERTDWNPDQLPVRTITRASVLEFGPVTHPANRAATATLTEGEAPSEPRSRPITKTLTRTTGLFGLDYARPARRHKPSWWLA